MINQLTFFQDAYSIFEKVIDRTVVAQANSTRDYKITGRMSRLTHKIEAVYDKFANRVCFYRKSAKNLMRIVHCLRFVRKMTVFS